MLKPRLPVNEAERIQALDSYNILDTLPEQDFDDITRIAAEICGTPIALVSLVDRDRQWFKSRHGLGATETPRELAFCAHAILEPEQVFVVPDSSKDERFHDNPLAAGEPHVVFYAGAPLVTPEGEALGTLCVIDNRPREINESQRETLRALANQVIGQLELRKKISSLEAAQTELQRANRELEKFAYVAAHDLKTPVRGIVSLIDMLREDHAGELDESGENYLNMLHDRAVNLYELISGILAYSRTGGIAKAEKESVKIQQLLHDIIEMLEPGESVKIEQNVTVGKVRANRIAIRQILQNLIGNAIKYGDKNPTTVSVDISENQNQLHITIRDNGPGIEAEFQERIFELFKTLGTKDRDGKKGSGVGLATVKKLVEDLGGSISLESVMGKGSEFRVILPLDNNNG